jgi:small-conductance mechanosensitive channel
MAIRAVQLAKIYSISSYLFSLVLGLWLALRALFLIRPESEWTWFIGNKEIIYLFDTIPLAWLHGFYLYDLNIGLLRAIIISALSTAGLWWIIRRRQPKYVFSSLQKASNIVAVIVLILGLIALLGFIVTPLIAHASS